MHGVGGPAWTAANPPPPPPPPPPPVPLGLRVRVVGLPPKTNPRDLIRFFSTDCGQSLVCTPERHIHETGSAILEFPTEMGVQAALRISGTNWNDHQIHVEMIERHMPLPAPTSLPPPPTPPNIRPQPEIHPDRLIHHQRRSPSPPSRYRPLGRPLSPRNRSRGNSQPGLPGRFQKQSRQSPVGTPYGRRSSFLNSRSLSLSNRTSPDSSPAALTPLKTITRSASASTPLPPPPVAHPSAGFTARWAACFRSSNVDALRQRLARVSTELEECRRAAVKAEIRVLAAESGLIVDRLRLLAVGARLQSLRSVSTEPSQ